MSRLALAVFALTVSALPALAAAAPTEADVKTVIEKISAGKDSDFTFRSVQIAKPRPASSGEIRAVALPGKITVVPVKADFTQATSAHDGRDHVQNYLFFKDDFGAWSAQAISVPGNYTSELKKVR
ncbi:MAG: hypothetical protein JO256_10810 [Alphaproteobacteria bacterium]|nr:hypothetical protein [Alphaproteobacteria bacterium]